MHPYGIVIMAAQKPLPAGRLDRRAKETRSVAPRRRRFARLISWLARRPARNASAPGVVGCPTTRPGW
jgi:hypothetical protein